MSESPDTLPEPPPREAGPPRYAGFNARMFAGTIDLAIVMLVADPLTDLLTGWWFPDVDPSAFNALNNPDTLATTGSLIGGLWKVTNEQHLLTRIIAENLLQIIFVAMYLLPFWFYYSSSPGKMLFRLKICDATTLAPMTRPQSVKRFLGYILSTIPLTLGFVWALFNRKHQGFHDLFAHTVVVVKPKKKS